MSSPEDLERALVEPVPRGSFLLGTLLAILGAAACWGWFGTVTMRVETQGYLVADPEAPLGYSANTYAAQGDGYRIRVGVEGAMSLPTVHGAAAARLRVKVAAVTLRPETRDGFDGLWIPVRLAISDRWIGTAPAETAAVLGEGVLVETLVNIGSDRPLAILIPELTRNNDR